MHLSLNTYISSSPAVDREVELSNSTFSAGVDVTTRGRDWIPFDSSLTSTSFPISLVAEM